MKKILLIILIMAAIGFTQEVVFMDSTDAEIIRGSYGIYSALDPVYCFDGTFMLPLRCLSDNDLKEAWASLTSLSLTNDKQTIVNLPDSGTIYIDNLYKSEDGLVKCRQTHERTIYPPSETPALFSFFRFNASDTLDWIENEEVELGWVRIYEDISYECIQAHMTQSDWIPPNTPALWQPIQTGEGCADWVQPTGAHDAYNIGDCVIFEGKCYESTIDANVWSPSAYPAGWTEVQCY